MLIRNPLIFNPRIFPIRPNLIKPALIPKLERIPQPYHPIQNRNRIIRSPRRITQSLRKSCP